MNGKKRRGKKSEKWVAANEKRRNQKGGKDKEE